MIEFRKAVLAAAVLAAAASLGACSAYGPKGDRGPPPPEHVAYPDLNSTPGDGGRTLKSPEEQRRLRAELEARKAQRR